MLYAMPARPDVACNQPLQQGALTVLCATVPTGQIAALLGWPGSGTNIQILVGTDNVATEGFRIEISVAVPVRSTVDEVVTWTLFNVAARSRTSLTRISGGTSFSVPDGTRLMSIKVVELLPAAEYLFGPL